MIARKKRKTTVYPGQTHTARKERGRPSIHVSLPQETVDKMDTLARVDPSATRTTIIVQAIDRLWWDLVELGREEVRRENKP